MNMCMTTMTCRMLICKDEKYLAGFRWGSNEPRWSSSPYDGKNFEDDREAVRKAEELGGSTVLFDALNGELI